MSETSVQPWRSVPRVVGEFGLGHRRGAAEVTGDRRLVERHPPALSVRPPDHGHDAPPRHGHAFRLVIRPEVIGLAAHDGEVLLPVAVEALAVIRPDDERQPPPSAPPRDSIGERGPDLVARRGGRPAVGGLLALLAPRPTGWPRRGRSPCTSPRTIAVGPCPSAVLLLISPGLVDRDRASIPTSVSKRHGAAGVAPAEVPASRLGRSRTGRRGERAEGVGHGLGRFPAVARLLLQGLQQDAFQAFGGVGPESAQRNGGVLRMISYEPGFRGSKPR